MVEGDVCIIGGGPAGLTLASCLSEAGVTVVLVEGGRAKPPSGGSDLGGTRSVGYQYPVLKTRAAGLGGSALRWNIKTPLGEPFVRLRELDVIDFEKRIFASVSGWPFGKDELAPYYRDAWNVFGLEARKDVEELDLGRGVAMRKFAFGPAATFTARLPEKLGASPAVTILTDTVVTNIQTADSPDVVSSLLCRSISGESVSIRASHYVLAAGGIENARLLLVSQDTHPQGLGNASDCVGRYFMEHPHYHAAIFDPENGEGEALREASHLVESNGRVEQQTFGLSSDALRDEGLRDSAFFLVPRRIVRHGDGMPNVMATAAVYDMQEALAWRIAPPRPLLHLRRLAVVAPTLTARAIGDTLNKLARRASRSQEPSFALYMMAEQAPTWDSRIRLGEGVDSRGIREVELDWRVSKDDLTSIRRAYGRVVVELERHFRGKFYSLLEGPGLPLTGGCHHMGATRMAYDPDHGVVDENCRVHGLHNLHVAGSSVFPTGGFANPTLTIVALAVRLARRIAAELGRT